jgi:hypothetical protein
MNGDSDFYKWINTTSLNTVERRDIIISLLNETHCASYIHGKQKMLLQ